MTEKLPVSVCMISGAEAHRIERALASVSAWAKEIIVLLNTEVNDGTEQIARAHGASVFREPWKGFIGQKNSVAEKASEPWLLNIDADEVVPPSLVREISQVISTSNAYTVYEFPRCTFYCGRWIRHGDWYPDRVRRLWRKGAAIWTGSEPHAYLESHGPVGRLHADLHHFTNDSISKQIGKIIPYGDEFVRANSRPGSKAAAIDLVVRPLWRFFRAYFLRLGFMDGWQGYYIAWLNAFSVVTKYARLREARPAPKPSHEALADR